MVEVSLLELVSIPNTRPVWPTEFASLVSGCEADPEDRTLFGVVADWCDERGETEYGRAWRWLMRRYGEPAPGPAPADSRVSVLAWNLMGGTIDWAALPWVCD